MTDTGLTKTRKRSYNKISDVQRSKLQEYFDGGMQTCGSDNQGRIQMAANETGLSVDQVKKWIGNTKAKAKKHNSQSGIEAAPHSHGVKIPTGCRGSSAYNMFCADFFKSDNSLSDDSSNKCASSSTTSSSDSSDFSSSGR